MESHPTDRFRKLWPAEVADMLTRNSRIAVVIAGDPISAAAALVSRHDAASATPALRLDVPPPNWLSAWAGADPPQPQVAASLVSAARVAMGVDPDVTPSHSTIERHWQVEGSPIRPDSPVLRELIHRDEGDPAMCLRHALQAASLTRVEVLGELAHLWGRHVRSIILVIADAYAWPAHELGAIVHAAEVCPDLRLMVVASPLSWRAIRERLDAHLLAVLEESVCAVESGPASAEPDAAAASAPPRLPSGAAAAEVADLRRRVRTAMNLARRAGPLTKSDPRLPADDADLVAPQTAATDAARNPAEALLFAALQADRRTTGLFRLNAPGGFAFGDRESEIDLLCTSLGIAVEVDGYFHFEDKSAYRRDRAKDFLMQRQGLFVLRFLAEDVVERLESIVDRVAAVVKWRVKADG